MSQIKEEHIKLRKYIDKLERSSPKINFNQEKLISVLKRDVAIHFQSVEAVNTLQMQQSSCSRFTVLYFENDEEIYILPFKGQLQMMKLKLMVANPSRCFLCYFQVKNADATCADSDRFLDGRNISQTLNSCICCCCPEETGRDMKIKEISNLTRTFSCW